jgi:predicted nucleic acid-binding Zn ribbon protein
VRGDRDRIRLAVEALSQVRADAWTRGDRPSAFSSNPERRGINPLGADVINGGRTRRDDPQPLTAAVGGLLSNRGWRQRAAMGTVFGEWARIVGPELAAHTKPQSFDDGELLVAADSAAWATQVRLLAPDLLRRLGTELGHGVVGKVRVTGPGGGTGSGTSRRNYGARHVRLRPQRVRVVTGKIESGHAGRLPGLRRVKPRDQCAQASVLQQLALGGLARRLRQDGVAFVLRRRVDHGP